MKMLDFARKKLSEHEHPVLSVLNTNTRAIALYTRCLLYTSVRPRISCS